MTNYCAPRFCPAAFSPQKYTTGVAGRRSHKGCSRADGLCSKGWHQAGLVISDQQYSVAYSCTAHAGNYSPRADQASSTRLLATHSSSLLHLPLPATLAGAHASALAPPCTAPARADRAQSITLPQALCPLAPGGRCQFGRASCSCRRLLRCARWPRRLAPPAQG